MGGSGLFEVVAQTLRAGGVTQLGERLRLDLADALPGDAELLADLFERAHLPVVEPEAEPHDLPLAIVELLERLDDRLGEQRAGGGGVWAKALAPINAVSMVVAAATANARAAGRAGAKTNR